MTIETGQELVIQRAPLEGREGRVSVTYPGLIDDVQVGHRVLVEDGLLRFIAVEKRPDELVCRCTSGGTLLSRKGVNLPDTALHLAAITERDWQCVRWAMEHDLDYLALSFVRRADEVRQLRRHLREAGCEMHVIAKIEKPQAVESIDDIIDEADGLMVARGDLGVEMDLAAVPIIQKDLIRRCQSAGKPVIVATQMLQSMVEQSTPTRAEASDVANAIYDGTDAVMLSGETSVGRHPALAVHTMAHIARTTERYLTSLPDQSPGRIRAWGHSREHYVPLGHGVWRIVDQLETKLVVVWSQTGMTARIFSKLRLRVPVIALSSNQQALRRMAVYFGVIPLHMNRAYTIDQLPKAIESTLIERGYVERGDQVVVVGSTDASDPGQANAVVIHRIGE